MKTFKTSNLWKRFLCGTLSALMIFGGGRSPTVVDAADTADLDVTISYTGRQVQTWTAPYSGYYYVEAYGAAGGDDTSRGGYGGYVKMYTYLNKGTVLCITCGQKGWRHWSIPYKPDIGEKLEDNPTYNGGARASNTLGGSGVGGGATSIALSNHGELKDFASCKNDVLMVAGGGAGGSNHSSGSGGLVLYAGSGTNYSVINGADISGLNGQFALGSPPVNDADGGGGGGGWIGGKSGLDAAGNSAGGGASFVNTSQNCIPIELVPDYNTKDGYVHITSTDYSGYYTISYDYDGGTANNPISYSVTQDDFKLTAPTKEGYTFMGWTGSNGDTPQKDVTVKKNTAENLSFKANWSVNYYYLNLNSAFDGRDVSSLPDGCTCDVYINGQLVESGVNDYFKQYPYGTTYEFKNFKTRTGLVFENKTQTTIQDGGITYTNCQPLKGVVKAYFNSPTYGGITNVLPIYTTKSVVTTFHRNTSSSDTQTASQKFTYGVAGQSFSDKGWSYAGHTLLGWAYSNNATEAYHTPLNGVLDSWINGHYPKVDLYAVWAPNHYTIKYDANGGTGTMADQDITYSDIDANMTRTTKCQYTKNGYLFNGWYASRVNGGKTQYLYSSPSGVRGEWYNEGSQPSGYALYKYSNGEKTGRVTTVDKDIVTFHAQWKPITWTVEYDANGGTNAPATQSFLYNSGEKLSTQIPVRTGYKFVGWRSGTTVYNPGDSIPSGTMNLDLKAMWIVNSYQVAFDGNGNTKGTMENKCFNYDEAKTLNKNTYSKNGYSFKNWNTKANGSGTAYSDEQTISKLANGENITASINPMAVFNINGNGMRYDGLEEDNSLTTGIAYKATYTTTGYTSAGFYSKPYDDAIANNKLVGKRLIVTFKAKASTPMQLKTVGLESISTGPISLGTSWNTYYVTGIIPDNWSTMYHAMVFYDPSTIGTVYIGDMSVSIAETVTLHAQWTPITWTVKYDANGGSGTMANTKHIYNGGVHITHNAFTRLGYSFNGWYATRVRNGKTEYLCGTLTNGFIDGSEWYEKNKIPSDKTVYKWRDNETAHICTYIDNDIITLHAQWSYSPVSVKVPQILTGDHTGKSQFRVKCDGITAGNITVEPDSSFNYTQDKLSVKASIKRKSSSNIINKNNHSVIYDIITDKSLTAGCWQGSFNIKLTLTKE